MIYFDFILSFITLSSSGFLIFLSMVLLFFFLLESSVTSFVTIKALFSSEFSFVIFTVLWIWIVVIFIFLGVLLISNGSFFLGNFFKSLTSSLELLIFIFLFKEIFFWKIFSGIGAISFFTFGRSFFIFVFGLYWGFISFDIFILYEGSVILILLLDSGMFLS